MTKLQKAKSFNMSKVLRDGLERLDTDRNPCCSIFNIEGYNILKALRDLEAVDNRYGVIKFNTNRVSNFIVEFKVILKKDSFNDETKMSTNKKSYKIYKLKENDDVFLIVNELLDLIAKTIDIDVESVA